MHKTVIKNDLELDYMQFVNTYIKVRSHRTFIPDVTIEQPDVYKMAI